MRTVPDTGELMSPTHCLQHTSKSELLPMQLWQIKVSHSSRTATGSGQKVCDDAGTPAKTPRQSRTVSFLCLKHRAATAYHNIWTCTCQHPVCSFMRETCIRYSLGAMGIVQKRKAEAEMDSTTEDAAVDALPCTDAGVPPGAADRHKAATSEKGRISQLTWA